MPARARRYMGRPVTSWPSKTTVPPSASIRPIVMRKLVVLPAPLGPSRPTTSPALDVEVDPADHLAAAVPLLQAADFAAGAWLVLRDRDSSARSSAAVRDQDDGGNRREQRSGHEAYRIHFMRST